MISRVGVLYKGRVRIGYLAEIGPGTKNRPSPPKIVSGKKNTGGGIVTDFTSGSTGAVCVASPTVCVRYKCVYSFRTGLLVGFTALL